MVKLPNVKVMGKWLLAGCRVFVGLLVAKTGIGLLRGELYRGYNRQDNLMVGGFILLIGVYIIFSTLLPIIFPDNEK